jgi:hypothetical protein
MLGRHDGRVGDSWGIELIMLGVSWVMVGGLLLTSGVGWRRVELSHGRKTRGISGELRRTKRNCGGGKRHREVSVETDEEDGR